MPFLYPTSRQFPFDEVCDQIVRELEKRRWQVPGITVNIRSYGDSYNLQYVERIQGKDFRLWFCRVQKMIPGGEWNDIAGVATLVIPKKELNVFKDESGPTFYLYVGKDYEADRQIFMAGGKIHSKLRKEPKTYLEYKGGCKCRQTSGASFPAHSFLMANIKGDAKALEEMAHSHSDRRAPLLVNTNDLGRQYDAEGDEPRELKTEAVMAEFTKYLKEVVLPMITSQPVTVTEVADAV